MNSLFKTVRSSISLHTYKLNSTYSVHSRSCHISSTTFKIKPLKELPTKILVRSLGYYFIHPEKMKQIVKGRDAHAICNYIASENYKKKIQEMMEIKKRKVFEELPEGVPPKDIQFRHIINCAQPSHIRKKPVKYESDEEEIVIPVAKKRKKVKTTIMSVMLKNLNPDNKIRCKQQNTISSITVGQIKKPLEDKYRKRTTILPIFLKKMQDRINNDNYESENHPYVNLRTDIEIAGKMKLQEEQMPAEKTSSKSNMGGSGKLNLHSSSGNNKEVFELFNRNRQPPTKELTRNKSDAKCTKSMRSKINLSRRRPRTRGKKHATMNLTSQMNLPVNGHFATDQNLTSHEIEKYHYYRKLKEPAAVSRDFDNCQTEKNYKPIKMKTENSSEFDSAQMSAHTKSQPSSTYQILQERLNQEYLRRNFFCH